MDRIRIPSNPGISGYAYGIIGIRNTSFFRWHGFLRSQEFGVSRFLIIFPQLSSRALSKTDSRVSGVFPKAGAGDRGV